MRNSKKKDIKKVKVYSKKYSLNYNNFQVKLKRKKNTLKIHITNTYTYHKIHLIKKHMKSIEVIFVLKKLWVKMFFIF